MIIVAGSTLCFALVFGPAAVLGQTPFTKAMIGDLIAKVEDRVDEFEEYLEDRGDNARNAAEAGTPGGRTARRNRSAGAPEVNREQLRETADELEESLDDLNQSTMTNRVVRKILGDVGVKLTLFCEVSPLSYQW